MMPLPVRNSNLTQNIIAVAVLVSVHLFFCFCLFVCFNINANQKQMKEKKGRLKSRNYYKIATELRVHHLALNPEGRQPITTANIIANIQLHAYNFLSK